MQHYSKATDSYHANAENRPHGKCIQTGRHVVSNEARKNKEEAGGRTEGTQYGMTVSVRVEKELKIDE